MKCPNCGHEIIDGQSFCPACGQRIPGATPAKTMTHWPASSSSARPNICPVCGSPLAEDSAFCPNCGVRVFDNTAEVPHVSADVGDIHQGAPVGSPAQAAPAVGVTEVMPQAQGSPADAWRGQPQAPGDRAAQGSADNAFVDSYGGDQQPPRPARTNTPRGGDGRHKVIMAVSSLVIVASIAIIVSVLGGFGPFAGSTDTTGSTQQETSAETTTADDTTDEADTTSDDEATTSDTSSDTTDTDATTSADADATTTGSSTSSDSAASTTTSSDSSTDSDSTDTSDSTSGSSSSTVTLASDGTITSTAGYTLTVPTSFSIQSSDDNGNVVLTDSQSPATITVSVDSNPTGIDTETAYEQATRGLSSEAYATTARDKSWYVVSDDTGSTSYYVMSYVLSDRIITLRFDYPSSSQSTVGPIIESVQPTFKLT